MPPSINVTKNHKGFTLVEISIVMIIIGLLIGGTFGGMKLIENMQVNKTVQDLKAIDSAALTFKDTYGRLPGDIANPAARLPSCTDAPCSTGGNGNRVLGTTNVNGSTEAMTATSEKFTFWHHLQAANLLSVGVRNTTNLNFGEGQPESPLNGGYRIYGHYSGFASTTIVTITGHVMYVTGVADIAVDVGVPAIADAHRHVSCEQMRPIDFKMDDGLPRGGRVLATTACLQNIADDNSSYANPSSRTSFLYLFRF